MGTAPYERQMAPQLLDHLTMVYVDLRGGGRSTGSAAFFEAEADDERKQRMRDNLAALPPEPSTGQIMLAQTPMRFHDTGTDAAPLFAGAVSRPELLMHIMGTLAPEWTIAADPGSLTVPVLVTHGRSDYTVPYGLWDGISAHAA